MPETESLRQLEPRPPVRLLNIEADGDFWKGLIKPKIRLMGRWLERDGFRPGHRVHVTWVAPGVLELRSPDAVIASRQPDSSDPPDSFFPHATIQHQS
jgi:hypothetical protein